MSVLKKIPCYVIHGAADTDRESLVTRLEGALGKRLKVVEPEDGEAILAGGFPTRHPIETEPTAADIIGLTAT